MYIPLNERPKASPISELFQVSLPILSMSFLNALASWITFGLVTRLNSGYKLLAMGLGDVVTNLVTIMMRSVIKNISNDKPDCP